MEGENRFRCLLECVRDGYLAFDGEGRVLDANPAAAELVGHSQEELPGLLLRDLTEGGEGDSDPLRRVDDALGSGGPRTLDVVVRRLDGSTFPAEMTVGLIDEGGSRAFMALVRDVSEVKEAVQKVDFLGGHDGLTGLPNRRSFLGHLEGAVARAERGDLEVAVLHVDLNRFSLINQGLGPSGGDELLRQTASRLREAAYPMDVVAHYSADEFLMLAADVDSDAVTAAESLAETVHSGFRDAFDIDGSEVYADAAIGISIYPIDADDPTVLLRHADAASQQAKRPGEGPTKLFAGETSDKCSRLSLATRLHHVIEREELVLHYQPIVDLRGEGQVFAQEALVRWRTDEGLVPPAGFIPLAEDVGLIDAIGSWVARTACRQAVAWRANGAPVAVSFNLSLRELWQPDIAERIGGEMARAGLEPGSLMVEVTESSAMTDPVKTRRVLGDLRERGLTLAMDDFGAGHSSLARLAELPCDVLKIDRTFISRLPDDPSAVAMVTAMIELARSLGMKAVAEGIETQPQLEFLAERGCPLGQGFLFSRPRPAEELAVVAGGASA